MQSLIPEGAEGVIETRTERIWLGPDGVVRGEARAGLTMVLDDAVENVAAVARLAQGARVPLLLDLRAYASSASREAREYYAGPENAKVNIAVGILIRSSVGRLIGNFFIGLNRTLFPTRLFSSPEEALAWLRQFTPGAQSDRRAS